MKRILPLRIISYSVLLYFLVLFNSKNIYACESFNTLNIIECLDYDFNGTILNSSGTYVDTLFGANALGCDSIITLNLTLISQNPTTVTDPISQVVCEGENAEFNVFVNPLTNSYQWQIRLPGQSQYQNISLADSDFSGQNSDSLVVVNPNFSLNGAFLRCSVIDQCSNTTTSNSALLTVNQTLNAPSAFELAQAEVCQLDEEVFYRVNAVQGADAYLWTLPFGATINGVDDIRQVQIDFSDSAASGDIYVQAINECGVGDSITFSVTVNSNPEADLTIQNETCSDGNGNIEVLNLSGGSGDFSFLWNNGDLTQNINNLSAGNYELEIFDNIFGCSSSFSANLINLSSPQISLSGIPSTCGNNTGQAFVEINFSNGPLSLQWSNGETSDTISNIFADTYSLSATDSNNCSVSASINIGNSNGPSIDSTFAFSASCQSNCNGTAGVIVTGGTTPYTYEWNTSPVRTSPSISNVCAGNYTVVVRDNNQCAVSASLSVGVSGSDPTINGVISLPNGLLISDGDVNVQLYRVSNQVGVFPTLVSQTLTNTGLFTLPNAGIGNFIVYAKPITNSSPDLENTLNTYFNFTNRWDSATVLNATCDFTTNFNLTLLEKQSTNGFATISGDVFENTGGNKRDRAVSVPDADIHVDREPQGIAVTNTTTDANGKYSIENLEPGSYRVTVDVPGLPMINSHIVNVSALGVDYPERNFFIDSLVGIDIDTSFVSSQLETFNKNNWNIYPNPANEIFNVEIDLERNAQVRLEILDIMGRKIMDLYNGNLSEGKQSMTFDNSNEFLSKGIYFINLKIDDKETVKKIIIN